MSSSTQGAERLLEWESTLVKDLRSLRFPPPVSYQYSPLEYAWPLHQEYVRRYFLPTARILFVGMNPGPFGMVQSGIPFGDVTTVKDWFHIRGELRKEALPKQVHPKRPILGLLCPRKEVSGQRFWGWARQGWTTSENFFSWAFVYNYCPLSFMSSSGKNITPDQLRGKSQSELLDRCNICLLQLVDWMRPVFVFGLGKFSYQVCCDVIGHICAVGMLPHPSPANPKSSRYWSQWSTVANDIREQCRQQNIHIELPY
ncbi:single-strand selective monofunctional uracil DNA glycosylase [Galdieria sulphuraria]|uniref:Single-strand selective monofunctional uracil DNA glycosylase n=1 Tax=Galdieria sulphuraria TaxID=130081 RepID=M2XA24_GALSU|nr:single-strand selective monofunctional uracil DNA glycosylase [Galdieria sulphuraria]EME26727.1 single-strand selective monofunctional uracil DNA glycosylase [Galdieria sulphuraria]|eukprot:XP_005703247.1 single-strand selective monofunctional uracil DNA glycosylase [Galdieria sulphuraria]